MRDAWSMFHSLRCTMVDSYCEREFQVGNKHRELKQRRRQCRGRRIVNLYFTGIFLTKLAPIMHCEL